MISVIEAVLRNGYVSKSDRVLLSCKSTDTKPTKLEVHDGFEIDMPDSAIMYEKDTKKKYMYDADTKTWMDM